MLHLRLLLSRRCVEIISHIVDNPCGYTVSIVVMVGSLTLRSCGAKCKKVAQPVLNKSHFCPMVWVPLPLPLAIEVLISCSGSNAPYMGVI